MSDPRRLMARLNPPAIRYDAGPGGAPEITPQDIAAALSMLYARGDDDRRIPLSPVAREVFCACWWQEGAKIAADKLDAMLRRLILDEYSRRNLAAAIAKLDCHIVESEFDARRLKTEDDRRQLSVARAKRSRGDAEKWPWNIEIYGRLPTAVLNEIRHRELCPDCKGRRFVIRSIETAPALCERCNGVGHMPATKVTRAKALGITEAAYRLVWGLTYEWAFCEIAAYENAACMAMRIALGFVDDTPPTKVAA